MPDLDPGTQMVLLFFVLLFLRVPVASNAPSATPPIMRRTRRPARPGPEFIAIAAIVAPTEPLRFPRLKAYPNRCHTG